MNPRISVVVATVLFLCPTAGAQQASKVRWSSSMSGGSIAIVQDQLFQTSLHSVTGTSSLSFIPLHANGSVELRSVQTYGERSIGTSSQEPFITTAADDSSIIEDGSDQIPHAGSPIVLGKPFWYRGQWLLPVQHSLRYSRTEGLLEADSVIASFSFKRATGEMRVPRAANDPHFEPVMQKIIGDAAQSYSPLNWEDSTGRWFEGATKAIRLSYWQDGILRVPQEVLLQYLPELSSVDPRGIRLWINGVERPLFVSGEADGTFDPGDYLEYPGFRNYGSSGHRRIPQGSEEYPEYLSRYGDTTIAWLTWGHPNARRIPSVHLTVAAVETLSSYRKTVHLERDVTLQLIGGNVVVHQDPSWLPGDVWGWGWLGENGQFTADFNASEIAAQGDSVRLLCKLMSWGAQSVTPAHRLRLRLNNSDTLATLELQQYQHGLLRGSAPLSLLNSGTNVIRVHNIKTSSSVNTIFVDWLEAEYSRNLRAESDTLLFEFGDVGAPSVRVIRIDGLSDTNIVVYKSKPEARRFSVLRFAGSGPYSVFFADTVGTGDAYMLASTQRLRTPQIASKNSFKNLRGSENGADYVLLTSEPFAAVADVYAAYVGQTYGVRTVVVDVADIFDEFGYGQKTPESLREFFKATTRWTAPIPSYVLLAGDASYDFRFVTGNPDPTKRPTNSIPSLGYPVSDPWLVALDDSIRIPQMYIGRIPVNTVEQFELYFDHHRSYVTARPDDWNKRYLFFSGGDPTNPSQIESFKNVNQFVIQSYVSPRPVSGSSSHFYKTVSPQSDFGPFPPEQVQRAIAAGGVFISYIGHSGTQTWDNGIGDPAQLQNEKGRFALISDFGCSTGKFAEPNINAFGELFTLGPTASAIGYVGNSALGFTSIAQSLPQIFYRKFLRDSAYQIGKAHLLAKLERAGASYGGYANLVNQVMMLTNTLIGDPIISLAIPREPDVHVSVQDVEFEPAVLTDDKDNASIRVPFFNHGAAPADSMDIRWSWTMGGQRRDSVLARVLPGYQDTLLIETPTRDLAGEHRLFVRFNDGQRVAETDTSDNGLSLTWNVLSTAFRLVNPAPGFSAPPGALVFLNPTTASADSTAPVRLELDTIDIEQPAITAVRSMGYVVTAFDGLSLEPGRRYHWRIRQEPSARIPSEGVISVAELGGDGWQIGNASEWPDCILKSIDAPDVAGLRVADQMIALRVTSSGFYDGGFGAIEINGKNIVPNTFFWGHTVAVLDTNEFTVDTVRQFAVWNTSQSVSDSLAAFLTAIPSGKYVAHIVITDGQQGLNSNAKNVLRSLGSRFIDSLAFRDSWAMQYIKGDAPEHAREYWRKTFTGKIIVDSTIVRPSPSGSFESPWIGPATQWERIVAPIEQPAGSNVTFIVIGRQSNGLIDTLASVGLPAIIDLDSISARTYPYLKIEGLLEVGTAVNSPRVQSLRLRGTPAGELALNYQSVKVASDTVLEGESVSYAAGFWFNDLPTGDSASLRVHWTNNTGSHGEVHHAAPIGMPTGIPAFAGEIPTAGMNGKLNITFTVDPQDAHTEIYETNNAFVTQVVVTRDSLVPVYDFTVDDRRLYDGDYVSMRPVIRIVVRDNSPLQLLDPTSVDVMLDGRRIQLGTDPDSLFEAGSGDVRAQVTVRPTLTDGAHTLALRIRDASGNEAEALDPVRFYSDSELKLMDAFAYPNPFAEVTTISFVLSGSDVPDQITLRLFSVAGRLLWKRELGRSETSIGMNKVVWDGRDSDGDQVSNGLYFLRIEARSDARSAITTTKLVRMR